MKVAVALFWLMDIMNMPFMSMFDTTYPLNGQFWVFAWILTILFSGRVSNES